VEAIMPEDPVNSPETHISGPLARAWHMQKAAAQVGFDWPDVAGPLEKVHEEAREVAEALARGDVEHAAAELGDLLFAVVNVARFLPADPAAALHGCCDRFERRFNLVREAVLKEGKNMASCTLEELDRHWEASKVVAPQGPNQGG
jgi:uncharacterized protein YabN with tetrapyrrole methylase and pyrophosphatase domain